MTKTISATKGRQQFFKLIDEAHKPGQSIAITVGGEAKVVMMSMEDFEGWQETLEIMSDQKLVKEIKQSLLSIKKGEKLYTEEEVKKYLNLK